jgi:glyceraldehyde 3-phosphate dehydrogenase
MAVGGRQVKVYASHDNEWGHACKEADITRMVAAAL